MIMSRKAWRIALPLGLAAFCGVTLRTAVSFTDETLRVYGFPVPWYSASGISSMGYVIAIGPLLLDLCVYLLLALCVVACMPQRFLIAACHSKLLLLLLWSVAATALALTGLALSLGPDFVAWSLDSYFGAAARRSHGLQFGLGK